MPTPSTQTTTTTEYSPIEPGTPEYIKLRDEIRDAYADNVYAYSILTDEFVNKIDETRRLQYDPSYAVRLSTLKGILDELEFGAYNNFDYEVSLDAIVEVYGDVTCIFGREGSPVLRLDGVPDDADTKTRVGGCGEIGQQPDGLIRLWWD